MSEEGDDNAETDNSGPDGNGYVRSHRKVLKSDIFVNPITFKIAYWILHKVSYKSRVVPHGSGLAAVPVHTGPGQMVYGRISAAGELGMKESTVRNHIERLVRMNFITIESNSRFSIITVLKWRPYQAGGENESKANTPKQDSDQDSRFGDVTNDRQGSCDVRREAEGQPAGQRQDNGRTQTRNNKKGKNDSKPLRPALRFDADDMAFAQWMLERVRVVAPHLRQPNLDSWANSVRLARERDLRSMADLRAVFSFANADPFWQSNILSPDKLRTQFDQLKTRLNRTSNGTQRPSLNSAARIRSGEYSNPDAFRHAEGSDNP